MDILVDAFTNPVPGLRDDVVVVLGTMAAQGSDAVTITGGTIANVTPVGKVQTITAAHAIDLDAVHVKITGPAAATYAVTLAAPTQAGIVKVIEMIATTAANAVTLELTNVVGGSQAASASFNAAGETLIVVSRSEKWVVIKELGVTLT